MRAIPFPNDKMHASAIVEFTYHKLSQVFLNELQAIVKWTVTKLNRTLTNRQGIFASFVAPEKQDNNDSNYGKNLE